MTKTKTLLVAAIFTLTAGQAMANSHNVNELHNKQFYVEYEHVSANQTNCRLSSDNGITKVSTDWTLAKNKHFNRNPIKACASTRELTKFKSEIMIASESKFKTISESS